MNRTFTFDFGNSHPHVGLFEEHQLKRVVSLREFLQHYSIEEINGSRLIASQVGPLPETFAAYQKMLVPIPSPRDGSFLGMPLSYAPTIGQDRLIQAWHLFQSQRKRIVLIDAGTFMTMDLIGPEGFLGGLIQPGLTPFLQSYKRGLLLPELSQLVPDFKDRLPQTTQEAISYGIRLYFSSSIQEFLRRTKPEAIYLTGGSSQFLEELMETDIPLTVAPHLIHEALHQLALKLSK